MGCQPDQGKAGSTQEDYGYEISKPKQGEEGIWIRVLPGFGCQGPNGVGHTRAGQVGGAECQNPIQVGGGKHLQEGGGRSSDGSLLHTGGLSSE